MYAASKKMSPIIASQGMAIVTLSIIRASPIMTILIPCLVQNGQPIFAITRSPSLWLQAGSYLYFAAASCSVEVS